MRGAIIATIFAIGVAVALGRTATAHPSEDPVAGSLINGPANFDVPVIVHGSVTIDGPAWVYGTVASRSMTVHGPLSESLTQAPTRSGIKEFSGNLTVTGPAKIRGPLIVDGTLTVQGPLWCASAKEVAEPIKLFQFATGSQTGATASPKSDSESDPLGFHSLQHALGLPLH